MFRLIGLLAAVLAVLPQPAQAHLVTTRFGDFYGGMLHPLLGVEYVLPWLALGLLAGLHGENTGRWVTVAFPIGVALGIALSLIAPSPERLLVSVNLLSFVIIGGLVVVARPLASPLLVAIGTAFGAAQGWENALAIDTGTNAGLFGAGVTVVSYIVITLVTAAAVVTLRRAHWVRIAVRAAGSWITAIGLMTVGAKFIPM